MPLPAAPSDAPAAAEDTVNAASDNAEAGGGGSRRSLRARPQHVSYRDDELAWEALFNQEESDDDDGGGGGDDEARGGEQRPKGRGRGRPPKNQSERVGPVETVLGPSGRQVRVWKGRRERGEGAKLNRAQSRFAVFPFLLDAALSFRRRATSSPSKPAPGSSPPPFRPRGAVDATRASFRARGQRR